MRGDISYKRRDGKKKRLAPNTNGGLMTTRSHVISDLWVATNSHAAFSASVFEAR